MPNHLVAAVLICATCSAQGYLWEQVNTPTSPGPLHKHAYAYDAARNQVVSFGGYLSNTGPIGTTYVLTGNTWSVAGGGGPSPRAGAGMCYDPIRQEVLLLGGDQGNNTNTFYRWNGSTWMSGGFQPISSAETSLAFDVVRGVAVALVGGNTFEWNGQGNWVARPSANTPTGASGDPIAFDVARGNTVVFTGTETWTWDGIDWHLHNPAQSPPYRSGHTLAYEAASGNVVLHGGYDNVYLDDTWLWNGSNWTQQIGTGIPAARAWHGMVYADNLGQIVMFGGNPVAFETWKKGVNVWTPASTSNFGQGCAGTAGTPTLQATPGSLPWLGTTQHLDVGNLFPFIFSAPFGVMGQSNTSWLGVPLPLDLGVIGMPGCDLLVDPLEIIPLVNVSGTARWDVEIPYVANIVGADLYLQACVLDSSANAFGMVWSNGVKLELGAM